MEEGADKQSQRVSVGFGSGKVARFDQRCGLFGFYKAGRLTVLN